jgi:hypothetical protein
VRNHGHHRAIWQLFVRDFVLGKRFVGHDARDLTCQQQKRFKER